MDLHESPVTLLKLGKNLTFKSIQYLFLGITLIVLLI